MTYNRSVIMIAAWIIVRRLEGNGESLRARLSRALRCAWEDTKTEARLARMAAERDAERKALEARPADELRAQIIVLECRDALRPGDYDRLAAMRTALAA